MSLRLTTTIAALCTLVATSALAGQPLASGPISFSIGDDYSCMIINVGAKNLGEVVTSVTKTLTSSPEVSSSSCVSMDPNDSCGVISGATSAGLRFCSVSLKGSTKPIRGKFCNTTTGECSEIR